MIDPKDLPAPRVTPNDLVAADNWKTRRRVLFLSLIFMGCLISFGMILGKDTAINAQATITLIGAGTSILCAYIFGSVWDDHNKRMFFKGQGDDASSPQERA